jgi:hypothetical protein
VTCCFFIGRVFVYVCETPQSFLSARTGYSSFLSWILQFFFSSFRFRIFSQYIFSILFSKRKGLLSFSDFKVQNHWFQLCYPISYATINAAHFISLSLHFTANYQREHPLLTNRRIYKHLFLCNSRGIIGGRFWSSRVEITSLTAPLTFSLYRLFSTCSGFVACVDLVISGFLSRFEGKDGKSV